MSTDPRGSVRLSRHFPVSAERVFDAWLDPAIARRWLFATPAGEMVRAESDGRVGGAFAFVERRDGEDVAHTGTYVEIDRPHRLVFDFVVTGFEHDPTRVAIDIVPDGDGCTLTLTHHRVPDDFADRTRHGWTTMLDGLAAASLGGL